MLNTFLWKSIVLWFFAWILICENPIWFVGNMHLLKIWSENIDPAICETRRRKGWDNYIGSYQRWLCYIWDTSIIEVNFSLDSMYTISIGIDHICWSLTFFLFWFDFNFDLCLIRSTFICHHFDHPSSPLLPALSFVSTSQSTLVQSSSNSKPTHEKLKDSSFPAFLFTDWLLEGSKFYSCPQLGKRKCSCKLSHNTYSRNCCSKQSCWW